MVVGEGDFVLPLPAGRLSRGEDPAGLPGVAARLDGEVVTAPGAPVEQMDDIPTPGYEDYFARLAADDGAALGNRYPTSLFETSRGCWWGRSTNARSTGSMPAPLLFPWLPRSSPDRQRPLRGSFCCLRQRPGGLPGAGRQEAPRPVPRPPPGRIASRGNSRQPCSGGSARRRQPEPRSHESPGPEPRSTPPVAGPRSTAIAARPAGLALGHSGALPDA